jgi:hypothetical protein
MLAMLLGAGALVKGGEREVALVKVMKYPFLSLLLLFLLLLAIAKATVEATAEATAEATWRPTLPRS